MRICIIGAGAIGGIVVGILVREEYNVSLVVKHPDLAEKIKLTGLEISGIPGNFLVPVNAVASPEELEGKELGVPTPLNDQLCQLIKKIDKGDRKITPLNFDEINPPLHTQAVQPSP